MLLLLAAIGYGWAAALIRSEREDIGFTRLALSPAFGAAALTLVAVVADRIGLRLTGSVPAVVTLLAGLAGYLLAWRTRRIREQSFAGSKPSAKIDQ
jgi:ABC-type branched-subunit amino acid transport system permease subunit